MKADHLTGISPRTHQPISTVNVHLSILTILSSDWLTLIWSILPRMTALTFYTKDSYLSRHVW